MHIRDEMLLNYDLAYQAMEYLTIARVVYYLTYIFDCGTHEIYFARETTTPVDLATDSYFSGYLATKVKIWFWGGPPDQEGWYEGSLLTMLIDKLFFCVAMEYYDTVNMFLETLNDSSNKKTGSVKSKVVGCA